MIRLVGIYKTARKEKQKKLLSSLEENTLMDRRS